VRSQKYISASSISAHPTGRTSLGCAEVKEASTIDDKYTRIANSILEALARTSLSSYENRLLMVLFRKTYGFKKKEDWIATSQIVEATGIHKSHISRAKKLLLQRNIIIEKDRKIGFNKYSETWKKLPKGVTSHHSVTKGGNRGGNKLNASQEIGFELPPLVTQVNFTSVTKGGISKLPKGADTKETITKENSIKEILLHTQTVSLLDWLSEKCSSSKIKLKVNAGELDRIVDKFSGKVKMRNALDSYFTWMIDANKKTLRTIDVHNCFVRQVTYEKTRLLAIADKKHEKMRLKR